MKSTRLKYWIFFLAIAFFTLPEYYLPLLQSYFPALQARPLGGSFEQLTYPRFWPQKWLTGAYQERYEQARRNQSPIAPLLVRSRNQLLKDIFGDSGTDRVVYGKEDFFYARNYCEAYAGMDFIGRDSIEAVARQLQRIQQLLGSEGPQLLVLLPPAKPRVLPQYLPDFYRQQADSLTNWAVFSEVFKAYGIPFLNFDFFLKEAFPYPVYPQLGLHWNYYGAAIAADSTRRAIEALTRQQLPRLEYASAIRLSDSLRGTDQELLYAANLIRRPSIRPMPYPDIQYLTDSTTTRPDVLIVGDSYYQLWYEYGIQAGLFSPASSFWFYFRTMYPSQEGKTIESLPLAKESRGRSLILLPHAEINLSNFGFGYLDELEKALEKDPS